MYTQIWRTVETQVSYGLRDVRGMPGVVVLVVQVPVTEGARELCGDFTDATKVCDYRCACAKPYLWYSYWQGLRGCSSCEPFFDGVQEIHKCLPAHIEILGHIIPTCDRQVRFEWFHAGITKLFPVVVPAFLFRKQGRHKQIDWHTKGERHVDIDRRTGKHTGKAGVPRTGCSGWRMLRWRADCSLCRVRT